MEPGKVLVMVIWNLERYWYWLYGNWKGIDYMEIGKELVIVKYVKTIGGGTLDRWQEAGCALIGRQEN